MALTVHSITLNRISARQRTTTIGDGGALQMALTVTGQTKGAGSQAAAQEIERQLHELARYGRLVGGLYVSSTEADIDTGLYRVANVQTSHEVNLHRTYLVTVSLTLTRIGGAGPGGNVVRRVYPSPSLQTNSWGFTSTPWYALATPVTAPLDLAVSQFLTGSDGNTPLIQSSSSTRYALNQAASGVGECKVWDHAGDQDPASFTPSSWKRVYAPDYRYAQAYHWAADNGFVRITAQNNLSGNYGVMLEYYDSAAVAWKVVSANTGANNQISCQFNGSTPTAWVHSELLEVSPERVKVRCYMTAGAFQPTITFTLERGKQWVLVELTSLSSTTLGIGLTCTNSRYVFNRYNTTSAPTNDCANHTISSGAVTFTNTADNWIASTHPGGTVKVMRFVATRSTAVTLSKPSGGNGGLLASQASVTSLAAYVGAFYYDNTALNVEAESATLTSASSTADAGASNGNVARMTTAAGVIEVRPGSLLPALGASASQTARVRAYWRVKNAGTNAGDTVRLTIWNATTLAVMSGSQTDYTHSALGTSGSFKWISCETTAWNGTDTLYFRCARQAAATADATDADECVFVCLGNGLIGGAYDKAHAALTEMTVWDEAERLVA